MYKNIYVMVKKGKVGYVKKVINSIVKGVGSDKVKEINIFNECYIIINMIYDYELIEKMKKVSYCYKIFS